MLAQSALSIMVRLLCARSLVMLIVLCSCKVADRLCAVSEWCSFPKVLTP